MSCISPISIKSPLHPNKYIYVPCGKCAWCRRAKRNEWVLRFGVEMRDNLYTKFVTLTYDDNFVPTAVNEDGEIREVVVKEHVQKFFKRLRKKGYKFKYFAVSEYGPKSGRPHYHALIFTNDNIDNEVIQNDWPYGFTTTYDSDEGALRYVTKYILKGSDRDGNFMLCSKRPSIGSSFVNDSNLHTYQFNEEDGVYGFTFPKNGQALPMPRYYKKKLSEKLNQLDYEINKVRVLKLMEERPKQFYLEKKFAPNKVLKDLKDVQKFEETIKQNYVNDLLKQFDINNRE